MPGRLCCAGGPNDAPCSTTTGGTAGTVAWLRAAIDNDDLETVVWLLKRGAYHGQPPSFGASALKGEGDLEWPSSFECKGAATVLRLAQHVSQRTGLSWLVISDNETAAAEVNAEMQRQGIAVLPPRVPLSISTASPSPPISLRAVVRDFFALSAAAGVLLQTSPFGGWIDSSFSSTAAAVGDAPLLLPARSAKGGSMASLQALTNASGLPLHSCFFKDQLEAFQQEVEACRKRPFKGPAR